MNDPKSSLPNDSGQSNQAGAPVSMGRRRLAKGVAPVVIGSLLSKPVLGAEYVCTVSGHASGNASVPADRDVVCDLGDSPEEWKVRAPWPDDFPKGDLPAVAISSPASPLESLTVQGKEKYKGGQKPPKGQLPPAPETPPVESPPAPLGTCTGDLGVVFNGTAGLAPTFYYSATSCDIGTSPGQDASMYQILDGTGYTGDLELLQLGRAVIASLLNAAQDDTYPVRQGRIVEMFNAVKDGGTYFVAGANLELKRLGVIRYLEKLYS